MRALTGGRGVDIAIEAVGRRETIADAVRMTGRGGQTVIVGAAAADVDVVVPAFSGLVMSEKVIRGSLYGSTLARRDIALLADLYATGMLRLDEMVSRTFDFAAVNEAVQYCRQGRGARAVMMF